VQVQRSAATEGQASARATRSSQQIGKLEPESDDRLRQNATALTLPDLARELTNAPVGHTSPIRPVSGGMWTATLADRALCSQVDPVREAQRWAEGIKLDGVDHLIVLGLACAYHIEALRCRTQATIIVLEPNLDLIRAVLHARALHLPNVLIVRDTISLQTALGTRLTIGHAVLPVAWPSYRRYFSPVFELLKRVIQEAVSVAQASAATLKKRLPTWVDCVLGNLPHAAGCVPASALQSVLSGRPAIVVAAGPSLNNNVHELKRVAGRAVIVAVNTSIGALERAGVRADLVMCLESLDMACQFDTLELNRDCPRVLTMTSHGTLFARRDAPVYPCIEAFPFYADLAAALHLEPALATGGSVAHSAFSLVHKLGASAIILVGQDLAYTGGEVYAKGTVFEAMRVDLGQSTATFRNLEAKMRIAASRPEVDNTRLEEMIARVPAWGGGTVATSKVFDVFRQVFQQWAAVIPGIPLINATEGGARILGFEERCLADVVDELPERRPAALPLRPVIRTEDILAYVNEERGKVAHFRHHMPPAAVDRAAWRTFVWQWLEKSGLLHAYVWPKICEGFLERSIDEERIEPALRESCDTLLARLDDLREEMS
jgi:hypothetical protein